jgi:mannose-6-phosphate isomerase-like protein (cupin superfamily)
MAFDPRDPRSGLASLVIPGTAPATVAAAAEYVKFHELSPLTGAGGERTWYARGQNFVVGYTTADAGAALTRADQPDEYMLMLLDAGTRVEVTTPAEQVQIEGGSLVIVPPGQSSVVVRRGGRLVRLFSARSSDLTERCANAGSYQTPHPSVAALEPWPDPPGGYRVRAYSIDVPTEPGRFGRIWRSTNLMVNWFSAVAGPRDVTRMSPHAHPDFEQCSLVVAGEYVHHIRWPWTTNLREWRADNHEQCGSPSVTVIPPTSIHTSQAIGQGPNHLIDIFAPPRLDFSEKPGWVLNADDYPMPGGR